MTTTARIGPDGDLVLDPPCGLLIGEYYWHYEEPYPMVLRKTLRWREVSPAQHRRECPNCSTRKGAEDDTPLFGSPPR